MMLSEHHCPRCRAIVTGRLVCPYCDTLLVDYVPPPPQKEKEVENG